MSNPAVGAKYVATLVVGVVGAGAFAGVSHDGRGGAPAEDPEPIVEVLSPSTGVGTTSTSSTSSSVPVSTVSAPPSIAGTAPAEPAEPAKAAQPSEPAEPEPVPTRARVRSRGS
jgi:hypothetical protein